MAKWIILDVLLRIVVAALAFMSVSLVTSIVDRRFGPFNLSSDLEILLALGLGSLPAVLLLDYLLPKWMRSDPIDPEAIRAHLNEVIRRLSAGPAPEDVAHGWDHQTCATMAMILKMFQCVVEKRPPEAWSVMGDLRCRHVARILKDRGIRDGDLFDAVIAVVDEICSW